ncbi:MAG: sulfurtransferase [Marinomonas sp.]
MLLQTLISAKALSIKQAQENLVMLDCRFYLTDHSKGLREYEKGHIPGAIFVDVHHELAGEVTQWTGRHPLPEVDEFADQLQRWGIDKNSQVVVYDDMSGAVAARAWWMLSQQGIDVLVLDGGMMAWQEQGLALSIDKSLAVPSPYRFTVSFPWAVTEDSVIGNVELEVFQLIDARANSRYQGENETIDPIAGHIPGAINRPFSDNLVASGVFKSKEVLLAEWRDLLVGGEESVHYCGSGITSCHNVLAMNYAGMAAKEVYVGSWSQWAKRMLRTKNMTL